MGAGGSVQHPWALSPAGGSCSTPGCPGDFPAPLNVWGAMQRPWVLRGPAAPLGAQPCLGGPASSLGARESSGCQHPPHEGLGWVQRVLPNSPGPPRCPAINRSIHVSTRVHGCCRHGLLSQHIARLLAEGPMHPGSPGGAMGVPGVLWGSRGSFGDPRGVMGVLEVLWGSQGRYGCLRGVLGVLRVLRGSWGCDGCLKGVMGVPGVFWGPGGAFRVPGVL